MVARTDHDPLVPGWAMRMAELAVDRLREIPTFLAESPEELERQILEATHVHAQNVADYLWMDSAQEYWDARRHVASARCPWSSAWITFRHPPSSNANGRIVRVPEDRRFYGGILHTETAGAQGISARSVIFLLDRPDGHRGVFWETFTALNERGGVLSESANAPPRVLWHEPTLRRYRARSPQATDGELCIVPLMGRLVALLTCAFANCRNVDAVERTYVPHSRKARRRGDCRGRRYYVLAINPVATPRSPRRESPDPTSGVSYHICRGHFADYSQGRGLFGRYHGRFWVPQHARGSRGVGEVVKDYAVLAPAGAAS